MRKHERADLDKYPTYAANFRNRVQEKREAKRRGSSVTVVKPQRPTLVSVRRNPAISFPA